MVLITVSERDSVIEIKLFIQFPIAICDYQSGMIWNPGAP